MNVREYWEEGKLDEAVKAAAEDVKRDPSSAAKRVLFAEILVFAGDLERADRQLDSVMDEDPRRAVHVSTLRQLIRAETWRRDTMTSGRLPELLDEADERMRARLEVLVHLREGNESEAQRLLGEVDAARPHPSGVADDQAFDDFRDLDDLFGGVLELLTTTGKYFWVPIERIESLAFEPPESLRDLFWRATRISVHAGPDGVVYVPCLYPPSGGESLEARLGRTTEWKGGSGVPVRGEGLRMFLVGDRAVEVSELGKVEFSRTTSTGEPKEGAS